MAGRPTEYRSEYCEQVIEWGAEGKSRTWMAAQLDVSRETIYEWMRLHPEFNDAMSRAQAKAQAHWEDMGQDGIRAKEFNGSVWTRSMAARFPDDWREKSEQTIQGPNGGPVEMITRRVVDPTKKE